MRNHSQSGGALLRERVKQTVRAHRPAAELIAYGLTGFIAANAFVLGGLAPFGVAFAAAARPKGSAAAALGAVLGYLLSFRTLTNMKYIVAMLALFVLRWVLFSDALTRRPRVSCQAATALSLGLPSYTITFLTGGNIYEAVLATAELLLACCAAYFFSRTIEAIYLGLENLQQSDITSAIITFCIAILALLNLKPYGISIGRVLAVVTILLAAQLAREAGGAIAGVAAGVCAGVLGSNLSFLMGTYGFGGLLAGVFSPLGKIASVGAFILVNTLALLASRMTADYRLLIEIFIAGSITLLVPQRALTRLATRKVGGNAVWDDTYKSMLTGKLGFISGALRDVAVTTRQVNEKLTGMVSGDISSVYHCAADRVCRKCKNKSHCWQLRYTDTTNAFNDAIGVLRKTDELSEQDFPRYFAQSCPNLTALSCEVKSLYRDFVSQENARRKVAQVRGVVTDQFEGMALMIDAMGSDLNELTAQDNQTAGKVTTTRSRVVCTVDGEANMTLEMTLPIYKLARLDIAEFTVTLSDICGREFDLPAHRSRKGEALVTLTFAEKAVFTVKWGATQLGNAGSRLCGDSYSYVDGCGGRVNIILSDGMGSGGAAAVDSTMTAELLKRLIEAGVSLDAALKLVNSALLVKSGDESLATIDITGIDLYTGRAEFYKAGAAPTFLRKSGKGGYVESNSLPVGILGGVSFEKNAVTLREGDLIVMVSDGAVCGGYDWLVSDLEHYAGSDPKALSEAVVAEARRRRDDGHEDDITAIAIMLERGV